MARFEKKGHRHNLAANFQHGTSSPNLPPIGVFWDIENCQVPKGKSALAVAQFIRKRFFTGHREAEFMCVCDISKENKDVIQELNNAQVTIVHINATCKNAADDKLRQSMRRFADIHGHPATIILISGDVNFAADLSDFHHRRHLNIVVLHNNCAPEPLLACAHQHFNFSHLIAEVPQRSPAKVLTQTAELLITNLPIEHNSSQIRSRLKQLSDNCGGRVMNISQRSAVIRFPTVEAASRAKKRMDREDVFGNKISVNFPSKSEMENDKLLNRSAKKMRSLEEVGYESASNKAKSSPEKSLIRHFTKTVFPPPPNAMMMNLCNLPSEQMQNIVDSFDASPDEMQAPYNYEAQSEAASMLWKPFMANYDADFPSSKCSTASTYSSDGSRANTPSKYQAFTKNLEDLWELHKGNVQNECLERAEKRSRHKSPRLRRNSWIAHQSLQDRIPHRRTMSHSRSRHCTPSPCNASNCQSFVGESARYQTLKLTNGRSSDDLVRHYSSPLSHPDVHTPDSSKASPIVMNELEAQPGSEGSSVHPNNSQPVELLVTNLDQTIEATEMKNLLLDAFRQHVMVLHVSVTLNAERNLTAFVRVPSIQDAQFAISQLHRRKIGYKRIIISLANNSNLSLHLLKSEVMKLLNDVPGHKLPLFKFRELFEKRYHQSIIMSELHKMKDIVVIHEEASGRMVSLNLDHRNTPSPASSESSKEVQAIMEKSFCELHCPNPNVGKGWAEKESFKSLPFVFFSLKALSLHVHTLLQTHNGSLPLGSFPHCYEHEFGSLELREDGVPLEHLVAAVPGVQIVQTSLGGKRIQWVENIGNSLVVGRVSPPLAAHMALFSREVVDLLKNNHRCIISFNKFIPAYHHHFGRQCRVADYGFTKLLDLLESIPHVIQIMGEGNKRMLTLTHRVQVKRFSADLLRILKSQASKQVTLEELPLIFAKCLGKEFDIMNYGVCDVMDMMAELVESTIVMQKIANQTIIAIPKREQTKEEVEKTKQFAQEVVELLRHSPQCSMTFNKFIPAYHHHFGRQCRVSDYGFTKLIELLEAIPDILEILETEDEKILVLKEQQQLKVFADQIANLIRSKQTAIPLKQLITLYTQFYGHGINLENFKSATILELMNKINHTVKVTESNDGPLISLVNKDYLKELSINICDILMEEVKGSLSFCEFRQRYEERFQEKFCFSKITAELKKIVQVDEERKIIQLSEIRLLARNVHIVLHDCKGRIPLHQFEATYLQRFGLVCSPSKYGFPNLASLIHAIPDVARIKGKGQKRVVILNRESSGISSSANEKQSMKLSSAELSSNDSLQRHEEEELLQISSPVDLLSDPVPSGVPSPCLQPSPFYPYETDLIRFDSPVLNGEDVITGAPDSSADVVKFLPHEPSTQDSLSTTVMKLVEQSQIKLPLAPGAVTGAFAPETKKSLTATPLSTSLCQSPRATSTPSGSPIQLTSGHSHLNSVSCIENIHSCEDLTFIVDSLSIDGTILSSQSTPTHDNLKKHVRPRSRIAAQFSNPLVMNK